MYITQVVEQARLEVDKTFFLYSGSCPSKQPPARPTTNPSCLRIAPRLLPSPSPLSCFWVPRLRLTVGHFLYLLPRQFQRSFVCRRLPEPTIDGPRLDLFGYNTETGPLILFESSFLTCPTSLISCCFPINCDEEVESTCLLSGPVKFFCFVVTQGP